MSALESLTEVFGESGCGDNSERYARELHDEFRREWSAKIREAGTAKGWSTWAAAFLDPNAPFTDTGMPSTETIVAELRRLDRAAVLREAAFAVALDRDSTPPGGGKGAYRRGMNRAVAVLTRMADEAERGKDTSGGDQPPAGESTPAKPMSYAYTDAQNHRLFVRTAADNLGLLYVWLEAENLTVGGALVSVWLPTGQARALERALDTATRYEFTDHTGDSLTVTPGLPWTVLTLTRDEPDQPPAAVRVVALTARLPELRHAIATAAARAEAGRSRRAATAPAAHATGPDGASQ